MNGVKYIGNGEFVVTEEWLVEVFSQAVSMMDLSCIEKIYTIAKRRYNDSLEPLHPCEHPGERADNDWFKVKCLAEILLEGAKGGR